MKQLNQEEAKRICDRVLGFSKADECRIVINGSRIGNIRYAQNSVTTAGLNENTQLTVSVAFGKRQGTASINEFDDKSLEKAVRRAEDVARLAPENPEFMPAIGKQVFKQSNTFSAAHRRDRSGVPRRSGVAQHRRRPQEQAASPPASSSTPPASRPSPTRTACSATRNLPTSISPAPRAPKTAAARAG